MERTKRRNTNVSLQKRSKKRGNRMTSLDTFLSIIWKEPEGKNQFANGLFFIFGVCGKKTWWRGEHGRGVLGISTHVMRS